MVLGVVLIQFSKCFVNIKGEVRKIFTAFDVVLVFVCPVQIHFAPIVRHGIRCGFVLGFAPIIAAAHKVACVVIPLKKAIQMLVNLGFDIARVLRGFKLGTGGFDRWGFVWIRCAKVAGLFYCLVDFGLCLTNPLGIRLPKGGVNFGE